MFHYFAKMDPGQGFEPRLTGPEPVVLPLDDPGLSTYIISQITDKNQFEK